MKYVAEETQKLKAIPRAKLTTKIWKTVLGLGMAAGAVLMKREGWFPDWFHISLIFVGGYLVAGDLVRGLGGFVKATGKDAAEGIRAIIEAVKGK